MRTATEIINDFKGRGLNFPKDLFLELERSIQFLEAGVETLEKPKSTGVCNCSIKQAIIDIQIKRIKELTEENKSLKTPAINRTVADYLKGD